MNLLQPHAGPDLGQELSLALLLARRAAGILNGFYSAPAISWKSAGDPVTDADHAANAYLVDEIGKAFPGDGILAEESEDDLGRLAKERVWLVDPLDGTHEFIARNGEFCVMLGLVRDGRPVLGVVYQPVGDRIYWAAAGQGAWLEVAGEVRRLQVSTTTGLSDLRPVVSRMHRSPLVDLIDRSLGVQPERIVGSLGLKTVTLASGQVDFYIHPSAGPKEWDTCAPEAILAEAGGIMTDCWDRPLPYNQQDISRRFGVLATNAACRAELAAGVVRVLREQGFDPATGF